MWSSYPISIWWDAWACGPAPFLDVLRTAFAERDAGQRLRVERFSLVCGAHETTSRRSVSLVCSAHETTSRRSVSLVCGAHETTSRRSVSLVTNDTSTNPETNPTSQAENEVTFVTSKRRTKGQGPLLTLAESAGLTPLSGCRMGICHTCVCRKVSGVTRDLRTGELSTDTDVDIQLCVSEPVGPVEIDSEEGQTYDYDTPLSRAARRIRRRARRSPASYQGRPRRARRPLPTARHSRPAHARPRRTSDALRERHLSSRVDSGAASLSVAKIIENMEIGHNVMHGQYDFARDPAIPSSTYEWDNVCPSGQWRHSHNFVHHTFTNVREVDPDLGYRLLRIEESQPWHWTSLFQPLYAAGLAAFFQWGVAAHDVDMRKYLMHPNERTDSDRVKVRDFGRKARKQLLKDYVLFPVSPAPLPFPYSPETWSPISPATCGRSP